MDDRLVNSVPVHQIEAVSGKGFGAAGFHFNGVLTGPGIDDHIDFSAVIIPPVIQVERTAEIEVDFENLGNRHGFKQRPFEIMRVDFIRVSDAQQTADEHPVKMYSWRGIAGLPISSQLRGSRVRIPTLPARDCPIRSISWKLWDPVITTDPIFPRASTWD